MTVHRSSSWLPPFLTVLAMCAVLPHLVYTDMALLNLHGTIIRSSSRILTQNSIVHQKQIENDKDVVLPMDEVANAIKTRTMQSSNDMDSHQQQQSKQLSKNFRWSRKAVLTANSDKQTGPAASSPSSSTPLPPSASIDVRYQCAGPEYDAFAQNLHGQVQNWVDQGLRPPTWGRRLSPLPPNSRLLMFGNSHMRQVALALAGQGGGGSVDENQIRHIHAYGFEKRSPSQIMAQRYTFVNNATLYIVANSAVAHCPHPAWKMALEEQIETSLNSMDAIVMGLFNPGKVLGTYIDKFLPAHYGCGLDEPRPMVRDLARVYDGPLGFISMFGDQHAAVVDRTLRDMQRLRHIDNRTALSLRARDYSDWLHHEGSYDLIDDDNENDEINNNNHRKQLAVGRCEGGTFLGLKGHRCVGAEGGIPDLLAWDISEFMYSMML